MKAGPAARLPLVLLVAAIAVGSTGYLLGITEPVEARGYSRAVAPRHYGEAPRAPTHAELAAGLRGPNRERFEANLAKLRANRRALTDEVARASDAEYDEAVASRSERRAFEGAPPVIPHGIDQRGLPACLTCHRDGIVIEDGLVAPAMSHDERLGVCTQCHVTGSERPMPGRPLVGGPPLDNGFTAAPRPGRGDRFGAGSPPVIPHSVFMRERCASCHGVLAEGLHTSHAWRQSCVQCHAQAAGLNQQPRISAEELPLAEIPSHLAEPPPLRARPPR